MTSIQNAHGQVVATMPSMRIQIKVTGYSLLINIHEEMRLAGRGGGSTFQGSRFRGDRGSMFYWLLLLCGFAGVGGVGERERGVGRREGGRGGKEGGREGWKGGSEGRVGRREGGMGGKEGGREGARGGREWVRVEGVREKGKEGREGGKMRMGRSEGVKTRECLGEAQRERKELLL